MADSYYGGAGAGAGGGGNEWELVSLTASAYAAAPGPVPVLPLHDAHSKTELPPAPPAAIFMSQHFNLPAAAGICADLKVDDEAVDTDDLDDIPCPESETEQDDDGLTLTSSEDAHNSVAKSNTADDVLIADAQPDAASSDHLIRSTSPSQHNVRAAAHDAAAAATDGITTVVGSASRVAANKVPSEAQAHAWWNKTFRFLQNNSRESLTFSFATIVGLAVLGQRDKVQLKLEFNVDTEKISCAAREPLGQVKLNMLVGGRPVAHG